MSLQRLNGREPTLLYDIRSTRLIESSLMARLPAHSLMQRAGQSLSELALALAQH